MLSLTRCPFSLLDLPMHLASPRAFCLCGHSSFGATGILCALCRCSYEPSVNECCSRSHQPLYRFGGGVYTGIEGVHFLFGLIDSVLGVSTCFVCRGP